MPIQALEVNPQRGAMTSAPSLPCQRSRWRTTTPRADGRTGAGLTRTPQASKVVYMTRKRIPLADAKKRLSELVSRVAFAGEEFVITRRGNPAAVLAPAPRRSRRKHLANLRGWIEDDDPFFRVLEQIREESRKRGPRARRRR